MKRKFYFVAALLFCSASMFAQPKSAGDPQLFIKTDHGLLAPVWSPDGTKIAVAGDNYSGIWVANADGSTLSRLTSDAGAGYKMQWSKDSKTILGRTNKVINRRTFHEVKVYDVASKAENTLVKQTRDLTGTPVWNNVEMGKTSDVKAFRIKGKAAAMSLYEAMLNDPTNVSSQQPSLAQFNGKMILNPALSPDSKMIAFQVPGKGFFVCKADGSEIKSMGKGSHPAWLPDNKTVLVARVSDNGNIITSSDIYAISVDSKKELLLTSHTEMIPVTFSVSPNGKKVAFENSANGCIYIMDLKY